MKKTLSAILCLTAAFAVAFFTAGCAFTVSKTTVFTPAVFGTATNSSGVVTTNLVTPATTTTVTHKERLYVPDGDALFAEDDTYGFKATLSSYSSTFPNVALGLIHATYRLIPTSTNGTLSAPNLSEAGGLNNKAVPFWFSLNGQFASGNAYVNQSTGTNAAITSTAVVPATGGQH